MKIILKVPNNRGATLGLWQVARVERYELFKEFRARK